MSMRVPTFPDEIFEMTFFKTLTFPVSFPMYYFYNTDINMEISQITVYFA